MIRTRDEAAGIFETNSVIDVYNISSGNYVASLYIPFYKNEKVAE